MLLTRSRKGELSGRKMVLNSAYQILSKHGDVYESFVPEDSCKKSHEDLFNLTRPTFFDFILNFFCILFFRWSFNEALFYSRTNQKKIKNIIKKYDFDYIYVDSIRMMPYLSFFSERSKIILDYDDLYSIRYKKLLKFSNVGEDILGFYKNFFIKILFKLSKGFFKLLLRFESIRMAKREDFYAKKANDLIIVSKKEAKILENRILKPVYDIPMIIHDYQNEWVKRDHQKKDDKIICCLLGNYTYLPNKQTLYYLRDEIVPRLKGRGINIYISIIGKSDNLNFDDFDNEQFTFLGFVDNLDDVICESLFMLCPIISGSGIKTKIIESMSLGIPVITNKKGVEGLPAEVIQNILVANTIDEYADYINLLSTDNKFSCQISKSAYEAYQEYFSEEVIEKKWEEILNPIS